MDTQQKYSIGQVLYIVLKSKNSIVPALIVEEVIKRTIKGEETSYRVQVGADNTKSLMLNELDGEIFVNAGDLQQELLSRASKAVQSLTNSAQQRAIEWFGAERAHKKIEHFQVENEAVDDNGDTQKVRLPDGTIAN